MINPQIIAFYLPQFHPIKENNRWFGNGFTEWTNVAKSKPLFHGHHQPRVPKDLGFYDLRYPEVREEQAKLAREAGITAFCYYHYWFGNERKILERPLQDVIKLGKPEFPFCVCWANHSWYKKSWNPDTIKMDETLLIKQTYPGEEDIKKHFSYLLSAFKDSRYYKINGKLVFVIYDILSIPDFSSFKDTWNKMAIDNGLPEFYFLSYTKNKCDLKLDVQKEVSGSILSLNDNILLKQKYTLINRFKKKIMLRLSKLLGRPLFVYEYRKAMKFFLDDVCKDEKIIPVIIPNWDNSPRRGVGAVIYTNSTPELFKQHAISAIKLVANKPVEKRVIFLKSWNEWGEGNYMEPDLEYGKEYITALKSAITECDKL